MGICRYRIAFESPLPSSSSVENSFYSQTGIALHVIAYINFPTLATKPDQVGKILTANVDEVSSLIEDKALFFSQHSSDYEELARKRDEINESLQSLAYIRSLQFDINDFYRVDFQIDDSVITLDTEVDQHYGVESLLKILVDLGGKLLDDKGREILDVDQRWKDLKKWEDYMWYDRPKK